MMWLGFVVGMGVYLGLCALAGHDVGWHGWWDPMCATTAPMEHVALLFMMVSTVVLIFVGARK